MRELIVASHNRGKAREMLDLLEGLPLRVRSLSDYPGFALPEETGATFAQNAALKAQAAGRALRAWAVADDSGLVVPALGGAPGLHSSRVADSDPERIAWLLERLAAVSQAERGAHFVCTLALADERGVMLGAWEGRVEGRILPAPRGEGGFGYDPVFLHEPSGLSFAQLTPAQKAAVSHRGQALRALRAALPDLLAGQASPTVEN